MRPLKVAEAASVIPVISLMLGAGAVALATWIAGDARAQDAGQVVKLPNEIEFKAARPGVPAATVLYGDPARPGLYVVRYKFAPGLKVLPHWHGEERTVAVLAGTFYYGVGERWDESRLKTYPAGTFFSEPPKMPHFAWARDGEVILQLTGIGPSTTTAIPQKQ
ncbi:MAG TPA: cupin domain-containing protein [Burkholderiales bacterium]|nr:cupin domain-containing protein [Burkholderiales bacterium]